MGRSYIELKLYEKALEIFNNLINISEDHSDAYNWKGYCLKWLKKYDEALINYDISLKFNPGNYETLSNKGNALRKTGHHL